MKIGLVNSCQYGSQTVRNIEIFELKSISILGYHLEVANEVSVKKTISTIFVNTVDMFLTTIKQTFIKTFSSNKYQYFYNSWLMNLSLASIPNETG